MQARARISVVLMSFCFTEALFAWETHVMPRRAKARPELEVTDPAIQVPQNPDRFVWRTKLDPSEATAIPVFELQGAGRMLGYASIAAEQVVQVQAIRTYNQIIFYEINDDAPVVQPAVQGASNSGIKKAKSYWVSGRNLKLAFKEGANSAAKPSAPRS